MQELSKVLAGKYEEIIEKINSFSNEYLNDEYKNICIEATKTLFLNNEENVKKGKSFSWAAGIVHAVGTVNNLFDSKEQPYIRALDLYKEFGVSSSTGSSKSKEVRNLLNICENNNKWILCQNNKNNMVKAKEEVAVTVDEEKREDIFRFPVSKEFVIAQKIVDSAWKEKNYNSKAKLANTAIQIYEDCADAYIILSNNSKLNNAEKKELLEKAVEASKNALRIENLEDVDPRLFKLPIAEPFFGAKYTLAICLWDMDERENAIKHASDILKYDPKDNLFVRGLLSSWLLIEEKYEDAKILLEKYEHDYLAVTNYNRVALLYKTGRLKEAESALRKAYKRNIFVVDYILKKKNTKNSLSHISKFGGEEEAATYSELGLKIWNDFEMIRWLKEMKKDFDILNFK